MSTAPVYESSHVGISWSPSCAAPQNVGALAVQPVRSTFIDNGAGWRLPIQWFAPRGPLTQRSGPPAVLCAPYVATRHLFAARAGRRSFIDVLLAGGRDVFTFDYQGQDGARPNGMAALPSPSPRPRQAMFWKYAAEDLRAVVQAARTTTGSTHVDLIGASMGGVVAAIYAALVEPETVAHVVAIGSPFVWNAVPLWAAAIACFPAMVEALPTEKLHLFLQTLAPLAQYVPPWLRPFWARETNLDLRAHRELALIAGSFAPAMNRTVVEWVHDREVMVDGVPLMTALPRITAPFLAITGTRDRFAPPENVAPVLDRLGTPLRRRTLLRVRDATHSTLFIGRAAEESVFHPVSWFLEK